MLSFIFSYPVIFNWILDTEYEKIRYLDTGYLSPENTVLEKQLVYMLGSLIQVSLTHLQYDKSFDIALSNWHFRIFTRSTLSFPSPRRLIKLAFGVWALTYFLIIHRLSSSSVNHELASDGRENWTQNIGVYLFFPQNICSLGLVLVSMKSSAFSLQPSEAATSKF